jgi:hypothetical protein
MYSRYFVPVNGFVFPAGSEGGSVSLTRNELMVTPLPLDAVAPAVKILFDVEIAVPTSEPSNVSNRIVAALAGPRMHASPATVANANRRVPFISQPPGKHIKGEKVIFYPLPSLCLP